MKIEDPELLYSPSNLHLEEDSKKKVDRKDNEDVPVEPSI